MYYSLISSMNRKNLISGSLIAYSLRKLYYNYAGSAIRVRRSSDNQELNIGFDGAGNLDANSLTSFVGAGNGFVTILYDQSGRNKNAVQNIMTFQPLIISGGTVLTVNGKPSINFDGIDDFLDCGLINNGTKPANFSTLIVSRFNTILTSQTIIGSFNNNAENRTSYNFFNNRNTRSGKIESGTGDGVYYRASYTNETFLNNTQYLFEQFYSSNVSPYLGNILWNGSFKTLVDFGGGISTTNAGTEFKTSIGRIGEFNGFYFNGSIQEVITYNSNKILDRNYLESNINNYYNIY